MISLRFVGFASLAPWLTALRVDAQTPASKTEPIMPDPGLVTDYWVHVGMVAVMLLFFATLSVYALRKFYTAMSDQTKGGFWLETHWGGLGGGLGGWRVSNALVYLILAALLGGLTVATISMAPTYPRPGLNTAEKESAVPAPSTGAPKATTTASTAASTTTKTNEPEKAPAEGADQNK